MPTSNFKKSKRPSKLRNAVLKTEIADLDVLEWLERERMEHESRMKGLGCSFLSARKEAIIDSQRGADRSQTKE